MSFGEFLWGMVLFFFWFMFAWIFISVVSDVFRRNDLAGWLKAVWIVVFCLVPFFGPLVYMIVRPKMTEQDKEIIAAAQEQARRMNGYSATDEIAKAHELKNSGAISDAEFEAIKKKALGQ